MRIRPVVTASGLGLWVGLALFWAACPSPGPVRPDGTVADPSAPDGGRADAQSDSAGALSPVPRPQFDPDAPAPCDSHTACYLAAKQAHEGGGRAGYLLALDRCEYYRARYQLEEFYGLCLLILADSYRHLDNFSEAQTCYQRFLDTQADDVDLALQARAGLDEVTQGARTPRVYRDYLRATALLARYGQAPDPALLEQARQILDRLLTERPDGPLAEKARSLSTQIDRVAPRTEPSADPPSDPPTQ